MSDEEIQMSDEFGRKPFSALEGLILSIRKARNIPAEREAWRRGYLLLVRRNTGRIVGQIRPDSLVDEDGNHFV